MDKVIKVCDRCKLKLTRDFGFRDYLPVVLDGWHTTNGKMICPQCYAHGLILFNKFMERKI